MSLLDGEIVVLVKHRNAYRWFVSERDFWVLDHDSWRRAFIKRGYGDDDPSYAERFGMAIVDESNAAEFLTRMEQTVDGDIAYPSLLVDFDAKKLEIGDVESPYFEDYMPPGWRAEIASFLDAVPEELRYWKKAEAMPLTLVWGKEALREV